MTDDPLSELWAVPGDEPPATAGSSLFRVRVDADAAGLRAAASQAADEDATRFTADVKLYERLEAAGFSGLTWDLFSTSLAKYATPILRNWLYTGEIFAACVQRGRPVKNRMPEDLETLRRDRDEREELICEAIARGLKVFKSHALMKGGWHPDGGASLKSYFVGASVGEFGSVYARWASDRRRQPPRAPGDMDEELATLPAPSGENPEATAVGHDAIRHLLGQVKDEATRTALFMEMSGYTREEIGEHLQLSTGAVAMRLSRLRKNPPQQQDHPSGESAAAAAKSGRDNA